MAFMTLMQALRAMHNVLSEVSAAVAVVNRGEEVVMIVMNTGNALHLDDSRVRLELLTASQSISSGMKLCRAITFGYSVVHYS